MTTRAYEVGVSGSFSILDQAGEGVKRGVSGSGKKGRIGRCVIPWTGTDAYTGRGIGKLDGAGISHLCYLSHIFAHTCTTDGLTPGHGLV
jgi:hypothetical protein